ncbi:creatininase family protein [Sulfitobacter sp. F26169L]|uniref:creatininase family protein n=1 Tax=Sulfitobacter sp. F26169L TaxID=2996015 RepID=UPI002260A479|nr:creatininase family protein [Sulfitobacter sp. F26169L]MCX7568124.1 creatininase family protein [Sulfitobacter sp. F26169L]
MEHFWANYTSEEFAQLDHDRIIAVLPVGAIEQHGPHLPLCVDAAVADGLTKLLAEKLPEDSPVLFLPTQPVGKSDEHSRYPGTLTLSGETLARVWTEIGASVARSGVRKIVLLNSHGGQISTMDMVVRELRIRHNMLAFSVNWFGFGLPDGLYSEDEQTVGIHAGDLETSIMLAMAPDLVKMEKARNFRPLTDTLIRDFSHIRIGGGAKLGWQAQDLHPAGACGDASIATAQKGRETLDYVTDRLVEVFAEIDRADPAWLNNEPEW